MKNCNFKNVLTSNYDHDVKIWQMLCLFWPGLGPNSENRSPQMTKTNSKFPSARECQREPALWKYGTGISASIFGRFGTFILASEPSSLWPFQQARFWSKHLVDWLIWFDLKEIYCQIHWCYSIFKEPH